MTLREITFPELTAKNAKGELFGLVEWLLESMVKLTDTSEGCDMIALLAPKLLALKGPVQAKKTMRLTEGQLEKLRDCSRPQGMVAMENLLAVSGYLKALHTATIVEEKPSASEMPA